MIRPGKAMKASILLSLLLFIGALGSGCCFTAATAEAPTAPPAPAPVVQAPPPAPAPVVQPAAKCECDLSQLDAAVKKAEMAAERAALAADRAEAAANKAEAVFMKKMKK
jgi:hypothetical protein